MRILVTGADGQMGHALTRAASTARGWEWHFHGRDMLDVTDREGVEQTFRFLQPDVVINAAAYTAVDLAESEPDKAMSLNRDAVAILAEVTKSIGAHFIHFSTDYVYDNGQCTPYLETDPVRPASVYAASKLAGEKEALARNPRTTILRVSWLYGPVKNNFMQTILRLAASQDEIRVVNDQIGSPTYTLDLAEAVSRLVGKIAEGVDAQQISGLFNYSNEGVASWYDFAVAIVRGVGSSCSVIPIATEDYPTAAHRPSYSVMHKGKIKQLLGMDIPHWQDALRRCLKSREI